MEPKLFMDRGRFNERRKPDGKSQSDFRCLILRVHQAFADQRNDNTLRRFMIPFFGRLIEGP
jgi:hypothetical protein